MEAISDIIEKRSLLWAVHIGKCELLPSPNDKAIEVIQANKLKRANMKKDIDQLVYKLNGVMRRRPRLWKTLKDDYTIFDQR